jgi:hypothetical protein
LAVSQTWLSFRIGANRREAAVRNLLFIINEKASTFAEAFYFETLQL